MFEESEMEFGRSASHLPGASSDLLRPRQEPSPRAIHEFEKKLRQPSCIQSLKKYVDWRRALKVSPIAPPAPALSPLSINLDLTVACNHACSHCVDIDMLNRGPTFKFECIKASLSELISNGLQSVILIGGGEPTLYRPFGELIKFLKENRLQVGIVTNGTMLERIIEVAHYFEKPDWVRLSLDAATQEAFSEIHQSKSKKSLIEICEQVKGLKLANPNLLIGYSFIVMWEGCEFKGVKLRDNVEEIPLAVTLAQKYFFDYISFKPFLTKIETTGGEGLFIDEGTNVTSQARRINAELEAAEALVAMPGFKIVKTLSMLAALDRKAHQIQTKTCHVQAFRQVLTPIGIYHCPAYRANDVAKVGGADGYSTPALSAQTLKRLNQSIVGFDAQANCGDKFCFYNATNHWIESLIESDIDVEHLGLEESLNSFL